MEESLTMQTISLVAGWLILGWVLIGGVLHFCLYLFSPKYKWMFYNLDSPFEVKDRLIRTGIHVVSCLLAPILVISVLLDRRRR